MNYTRFYLVRHGETEWNKVNRLRGRSDILLNEVGLKQAETAGQKLSSKKITFVYTSPLKRAIQTAQKISKYHNLEPVINESFHDFDFGKWSGMQRDQIYKEWEKDYKFYKEHPQLFKAPGGESFWDVRKRVLFGLKELACKHTGQEIVIVSHNVTLVITILAILDISFQNYWSINPDNASITVFTSSIDGKFVLECFNDTCHLSKI